MGDIRKEIRTNCIDVLDGPVRLTSTTTTTEGLQEKVEQEITRVDAFIRKMAMSIITDFNPEEQNKILIEVIDIVARDRFKDLENMAMNYDILKKTYDELVSFANVKTPSR